MAYNIGDNPTVLTAPVAADLLAIHDVSLKRERSISVATLGAMASNSYIAQVSVPLTGATVVCTPTGNRLWLRIKPAGTLANLQVDLPAKATALDGQEVILTFTAIITALVVDDNGAAACSPAHTAASAGQSYTYKYHAVDDTWYCVGNSTT